MTVLVISDIHAHYGVINTQIRHAEQSCGHAVSEVLILGDFGFFADDLSAYFRQQGQRFLRPVSCLDGNHEDHSALPDLAASYADVVTYLPRGSVHRIGQMTGLCLGGARYMDAWSTPRGCEITDDEVAACLAHDPAAIDLVLTHDCPEDIGVPGAPGMEHYGKPGVRQMARLVEHFRPRLWLFGHHHRWFDRTCDGTRYVGLPQSWVGYVLLEAGPTVTMIQHDVPLAPRPWWKRWLGLG